jgi:hypothetical protein
MSLYEERKEVRNHETGEICETSVFKNIRHDNEPSYIKLYVSDLCKLNDIPKTGNAVLNELLRLTDYNNEIILNAGIKKRITEKLKIKKGSLDNNISKLKKHKILVNVERGIYMLNPNLFGKGKWEDIKKLRIEWEYSETGREVKKVETDTHIQTEMDFTEAAEEEIYSEVA